MPDASANRSADRQGRWRRATTGALADWGRYLALRPPPADSGETAGDVIERGLQP